MRITKSYNSTKNQKTDLAALSQRKALKIISSISVGAAIPVQLLANESTSPKSATGTSQKLKIIATEEAWCIPEIAEGLKSISKKGSSNLDLL